MPTMSSSFSLMLYMAQAPIPVQPLVSVGPSCDSCLPTACPAPATLTSPRWLGTSKRGRSGAVQRGTYTSYRSCSPRGTGEGG